jgi:amphi-Trp domain-containing protein
MELVELKEKTTVSREEAARRLHAIADELASGNDVRFERGGVEFMARVPSEVELKVEFELEDDGAEFEVEICW